MALWTITISLYNAPPEAAAVTADTLLDALDQGITDMGFEGNDEGTFYITAAKSLED